MLFKNFFFLMIFFFRNIHLSTLDGYYLLEFPRPTVRTHLVLNYIGPQDGIKVYTDGTLGGQDDLIAGNNRSPGKGDVILGRRYTNENNHYGSFDIDELMFFNETLPVANFL